LITRSYVIPAGYFGPWIFLLAASGATASATWGTWWAVPSFFVYGVLYSAADHRHRELSHGTPFKTG
jgi:fatty acid desaturase